MLKDITSIKLTGANFNSSALFNFFIPNSRKKEKTVKGALLYGRNGTGKSTIAKGFRKLAGEDVPSIDNANFYDADSNTVILTDEEKKHIFVFDEDFVTKNVKMQEDHLDTIVMLGKSVDLTEKIENAKHVLNILEEKCNEAKAKCDEYQDEQNVISPKYYIVLMKKALQGDDNWAGREKIIKGTRVNANVNDETYKRFLNRNPVKSKAELLSDFQTKLNELTTAQNGTAIIDESVPLLSQRYVQYDDEEIQNLLLLKVEKPELTLREKKLLTMVQNGESEELNKRKILFQNEETVECPYCYQPLSFEYKKSLVQSIEKVLKKEVTDHQHDLKENIIEPIDIKLDCFKSLSSYQMCIGLISKINNEILINNNAISNKYDNPYEPIIKDKTNIKGEITKLQSKLLDLENERISYNTKIKQTGPIIEALQSINNDIAYYDIIELSKQFNKQKEMSDKKEASYKKIFDDCEEKRKVIETLTAQKNNVKIAIDVMNSYFKYIFFADNRLQIEYTQGGYKLLSNGESVKPCNVSAGERNIIGLCYFFTSICQGKDEENATQEQCILVIDDPISSYDSENRIGIMSFLKYKLGDFLTGNQNTKALVMTHDLMTLYDLQRIFKEIIDDCKKKEQNQSYSPCFNSLELLANGDLKTFSFNQRQEYTEILKIIYNYARGIDEGYSLIIGNMMRQALEAFSTFEYRKSIDDVSNDDDILSLLGDQDYILYFKNLMYRLVLNGGSHKAEQVKSMNDLRFFDVISENEKIRTAKDILCFIYLLNKKHLLEHLKDCQNVEATLEDWCQEIKS